MCRSWHVDNESTRIWLLYSMQFNQMYDKMLFYSLFIIKSQ